MNLSDAKHAFITGGASGIGLGIATALASRGMAVTLADIDREVLEEVVGKSQGRFRGHVLDTRDRPGWVQAKTAAERALGPVDILVNNAGIAPDGRELADMDPLSFDRIVAINLSGVFNGISSTPLRWPDSRQSCFRVSEDMPRPNMPSWPRARF